MSVYALSANDKVLENDRGSTKNPDLLQKLIGFLPNI